VFARFTETYLLLCAVIGLCVRKRKGERCFSLLDIVNLLPLLWRKMRSSEIQRVSQDLLVEKWSFCLRDADGEGSFLHSIVTELFQYSWYFYNNYKVISSSSRSTLRIDFELQISVDLRSFLKLKRFALVR